MIQHSIQNDLIHISIANKDFSYRIPSKKIGKTVSWLVGKTTSEGIIIKNASLWTLQLFTKQITDPKYIEQFKIIIQEYSPKNSIDWKATDLALKIQNEYSEMTALQANEKMEEGEIISFLEDKYKLD